MEELEALTQTASFLRQQRYINSRVRENPAQAVNGSTDRGVYVGLDASRQRGRVRLSDGSVIDAAVLTTGDIIPGSPVLVRRSGGYNSITGIPR